jgi:hypothetical protein
MAHHLVESRVPSPFLPLVTLSLIPLCGNLGQMWFFHTIGEKISLIAEEAFFSRSGKGERLSDKLILVIGLKVRTQTLG